MKTFDLKKEEQRVQFVLQKRNIPSMRASVGLTLDVSGSMQSLFTSGAVQRLVEQIVPVALRADDNGNLDVYTFSDDSHAVTQVAGATASNYQNFVKEEILNNSDVELWNGTDYYPVINKMMHDYGFYQSPVSVSTEKKGFFSKMFGGSTTTSTQKTLGPNSASGEAVINYFITDGENSDKEKTYELLREIQNNKCNVYFLFIGLGNANFNFIQKCGADFSNVGFINVSDLRKFVDADDIYEQLLPEELTQWVKQKAI